MGDPRKNRAQFQRPKKPWDKPRLDSEKVLIKEYGLSNKKEIHRTVSQLRKFASQAKSLMTSSTEQSEKEKKSMLIKLNSLALIKADAELDDVLALDLKNILERRLQTQLVRKGLANTMKQARQFIVHEHVKVGDNTITFPSYVVSKEEENKITFLENSSLAREDHPERPEQIFKMKEELRKAKEKPKVEETEEEVKAEEPKVEEKASEVKKEKKEAPKKEVKEEKPAEKAEEKVEEKKEEEKKVEPKPEEKPKGEVKEEPKEEKKEEAKE